MDARALGVGRLRTGIECPVQRVLTVSRRGHSAKDDSTVSVDAYGCHLEASPGSLGEEPPGSWKEVCHQINGHLMRIAVGPTRLLAESIEGLTRLVRGVAGFPAVISRRIAGRFGSGSDRANPSVIEFYEDEEGISEIQRAVLQRQKLVIPTKRIRESLSQSTEQDRTQNEE